MRRRAHRWSKRHAAAVAAAAALLLVGRVAPTQPAPDTSQWRCRLCPFEHGVSADSTVGASYASDGAARFADATGYDRSGGYLLAAGAGRYADDRQRLVWRVEDLGLDARALSAHGDRGAIDYRVSYRELPHDVFDTTATVFRSSGGDLVLPPGWVRAPVTPQMTALDSSLLAHDIASHRDTLDLGVKLRPREPLEVYTEYRVDEHSGTRISGASFFNTTSQLPLPFDEATAELAAGVRYASARGALELGYRGSSFDERLPVVTWDNPFTGPPGAERGALAGSPDNSFHSLALGGAFRFLAHTAVAFSAGAGRGRQDEPLLPYTTNALLTTAPLPRAALDGSVDTSHFAVTISARPWTRVGVHAAYRYDERDNRTPIAAWTRVVADAFQSAQTESNVAYDFKRANLHVAADADASRRLRLSAGYDRTARDRNQQEVAGQTESGGWGRLRWRFAPGFELSARRGTARRDIDRYDTALATELKQNPLLAKYNLAYRFRTYEDVAFTAAGSKRPFTVAFSARKADDDYTRSRLGLASDEDRRVAADLGWTFTPQVSLFASVSDDRIEALQTGSESFGAPDWRGAHTDRFRTFSGGLRLERIPPRFDLTLDLSRADGTTAIDLTTAGGGDAFPDLRSKLDALRFEAHYRRSARLSVLLALRYQHLATADWALANVEPATVAGLLALGADPYRYHVTLLGAGVIYRFDAAAR